MKAVLRRLGVIFCVLFLCALAFGAANDGEKVVPYTSCGSGAFIIELNQGGRSGKADILRALQTLADYPQLVSRPVRLNSYQASLEVSVQPEYLAACATDRVTAAECAQLAGWSELQWRLKGLRGVSVSCLDLPSKAGAASPARRDQGAVTGSN